MTDQNCGHCDNCTREPGSFIDSPAILEPLARKILTTVRVKNNSLTPLQLVKHCKEEYPDISEDVR